MTFTSPTPEQAFLAVWLFALGTVVGSFLNVVIHRLPRRESLVRPGSRCPGCRQPIRWYDNIPIVSWILLRGRCRSCGAKIPIRYPLVEAGVGLVFVCLGVAEGLARGANLPMADGAAAADHLPGEFALVFVYHATLLCGLIAAWGMVADGFRPAVQLISFLVGLGFAVPLVWPTARPVGFDGVLYWGAASVPQWRPLLDGGLGLLAGAVLGATLARVGPHTVEQRTRGCQALVSCVGCYLGWQAALGVTAAAAALEVVVWLLVRGAGRRMGRLDALWPTAASITASVWLWLMAWRWLYATSTGVFA